MRHHPRMLTRKPILQEWLQKDLVKEVEKDIQVRLVMEDQMFQIRRYKPTANTMRY